MQSRKQVRLSTFERPKQEEIPPQRRPGPSPTSPPPHILQGRGGREKQNAHTRLCQQVVHQHSCTYKPCRQSHMLATRKHVTCQTLVQVQTCARPSISYAHTSHLDTRTRAPRWERGMVFLLTPTNREHHMGESDTRSHTHTHPTFGHMGPQ